MHCNHSCNHIGKGTNKSANGISHLIKVHRQLYQLISTQSTTEKESTMGNTLSPIRKLRSSKRKDRAQTQDLSGLEIFCDPLQAGNVSEAFELPQVDETDYSSADLSYSTAMLETSRTSVNKGKRRSRKSSRRSSGEDSSDLLACIIPGMDPSELLQLVEECAMEEKRERDLQESRSREFRREGRHRSSRNSVKNVMRANAA